MKAFIEDHHRAIGVAVLLAAFAMQCLIHGENVAVATFVIGFVGLVLLLTGN